MTVDEARIIAVAAFFVACKVALIAYGASGNLFISGGLLLVSCIIAMAVIAKSRPK